MNKKKLSVGYNRLVAARKLRVRIGLWAEIRNLARAASAGDKDPLVEFQQLIQYAPPEMKADLLRDLEEGKV
jgi:hypothetical protein